MTENTAVLARRCLDLFDKILAIDQDQLNKYEGILLQSLKDERSRFEEVGYIGLNPANDQQRGQPLKCDSALRHLEYLEGSLKAMKALLVHEQIQPVELVDISSSNEDKDVVERVSKVDLVVLGEINNVIESLRFDGHFICNHFPRWVSSAIEPFALDDVKRVCSMFPKLSGSGLSQTIGKTITLRRQHFKNQESFGAPSASRPGVERPEGRGELVDQWPYICLEPSCRATIWIFQKKSDWMKHLRLKHWVNYKCPFDHCTFHHHSSFDFELHLTEMHLDGTQVRFIPEWVKRAKQLEPPETDEGEPCPLCLDILRSNEEYGEHVGQHQEQLALIGLHQDA
ncbi:hypothetical protein F5Y16DRAFT_395355 [Xylariaceae sp. FL0255]|nr:hypothetical protein F5Y16DRAFT_395355 [Xylariaceae sp. FL0255]